LAGLVVGVLTGMMVAYIGLPPFIVTLGTYTAIRGTAYLAAGGTTVINRKIGFAWIGNGYVGPVPWLVVIALLTIAKSQLSWRLSGSTNLLPETTQWISYINSLVRNCFAPSILENTSDCAPSTI
jgi:predicted ABC-type sugar transport system permease subunit